MQQLPPPNNSTAFALYLLLEAGMNGLTSFDTVVSDGFFKFSTRVSNLINDHELQVHKKPEAGSNRFGHHYTRIRYCLFTSDLEKNLELYNQINIDK